MVFLSIECFSAGTDNKLKLMTYAAYKIFQKININVYVTDLLENIGFSKTFNVPNFQAFHENVPLY